MRQLIDILRTERHLAAGEYRSLIENFSQDLLGYAMSNAREVAVENFGNGIYVRALLEITNCCGNSCLYCGLRRENRAISRYRMTGEEIMDACGKAYGAGFRTFVLQGGEDPAMTAGWVEEVVRGLRRNFPDAAITLSLGEWDAEAYRRFFAAGADRYLLRHETADAAHFRRLHGESLKAPADCGGGRGKMALSKRMQCLKSLHDIGFQAGTGIMAGSPYQTADSIVRDILFIGKFRPEMIGIGPFIPQKDTPFADFRAGSAELTLMLLSIFRLMFPKALIPSTTALATIAPENRCRGILAGANVVMPNITPLKYRGLYKIYDNKAVSGAEAGECLGELADGLEKKGYRIASGRGDYGTVCGRQARHAV